MSPPVKRPVTSLPPCEQKSPQELIRPYRKHNEREYSRCLPNAMNSSHCLLALMVLPLIGYPICM